MEASSENTALSDALYYRDNVNELPAGSSVPVSFYLDLSQRESTMGAANSAPAAPEPPRKIIEVRATTPEGESAIKTAIVPL